MIYVRIEIWPMGRRENARALQEIVIENSGNGCVKFGDYVATLSHSSTYKGDCFNDPINPQSSEVWKKASGIKHNREQSPAHLVYRVLRLLLADK